MMGMARRPMGGSAFGSALGGGPASPDMAFQALRGRMGGGGMGGGPMPTGPAQQVPPMGPTSSGPTYSGGDPGGQMFFATRGFLDPSNTAGLLTQQYQKKYGR